MIFKYSIPPYSRSNTSMQGYIIILAQLKYHSKSVKANNIVIGLKCVHLRDHAKSHMHAHHDKYGARCSSWIDFEEKLNIFNGEKMIEIIALAYTNMTIDMVDISSSK